MTSSPDFTELRLVADVAALPGQEARLRERLLALVGPSRAEPGCLQYDLHEDRDRPGHFVFFERWRDAAALDAHTRMPHYVAHGPSVRDMVAGPAVLTKLAIIE